MCCPGPFRSTASSSRPAYSHPPPLNHLPALPRKHINLSLFYMIDLLCDERLRPLYERLGMGIAAGMMMRDYDNQSGQQQ